MPGEIKAILFDLGGTLIEYENLTWQELSVQGFELAFDTLKGSLDNLPERERFVRLFDDHFEARYGDSLKSLVEVKVTDLIKDCFTTLKLPGDGVLRKEFLEAYYRPITDQLTMVKDAPQVLDRLKSEGFKLGLVSNTIFPGDFHRRELRRFGLMEFFDHLLFSCELGFKKPHPAIFREALEALEVKPEEAVFIGDRLKEDIAGPKSLGMKTILKLREERPGSGDVTPDAVINNLSDLARALSTIT
jgi:putative hydrolase of the HAD superfamily